MSIYIPSDESVLAGTIEEALDVIIKEALAKMPRWLANKCIATTKEVEKKFGLTDEPRRSEENQSPDETLAQVTAGCAIGQEGFSPDNGFFAVCKCGRHYVFDNGDILTRGAVSRFLMNQTIRNPAPDCEQSFRR
jgi:hypothetical protein